MSLTGDRLGCTGPEALVGLVQRPRAWPDPGDQLLAVEQGAGRVLLEGLVVEVVRHALGAGRLHRLDDGAGLFETFGERPPELIELPLLHPRCISNRLSSPRWIVTSAGQKSTVSPRSADGVIAIAWSCR
jgi:hypothetical protein